MKGPSTWSPILSISYDHTTLTTLSAESRLPPPRRISAASPTTVAFLSQKHGLADTRAHPHAAKHTYLPHSQTQTKAPPSPTSHEHADEHVIASARYFNEHRRQSSAGDTSERRGDITRKTCLLGTTLWSPPSDSENMERHSITRRRSKKPLLVSFHLTLALAGNVTSPVIFRISSYFSHYNRLHFAYSCAL